MKAQPEASADSIREARPSRERGARPDRELVARQERATTREPAAVQGNVASDTAPPTFPAPAAPVAMAPTASDVALPAVPVEAEQARITESGDLSSSKKAEASSGAAVQSRRSDENLQKQKADGASAQPEDWLQRIDDLLRNGEETDARQQLLFFRKQFPHFPLPPRLQALLPPDQR